MIDQLTATIQIISKYPDRTKFDNEMDWKNEIAIWLEELALFTSSYDLSVEELKVMIEQINLAIDSMDVAITALNYQGVWTALDENGNQKVYSLGQSVSHNGSRWASNVDNNTEEPSETAVNWEKISLDAYSKTEVNLFLLGKANTTDVNNALNNKQDKLISGENIKKLNGEDLNGPGDITIEMKRNLFELNFGGL